MGWAVTLGAVLGLPLLMLACALVEEFRHLRQTRSLQKSSISSQTSSGASQPTKQHSLFPESNLSQTPDLNRQLRIIDVRQAMVEDLSRLNASLGAANVPAQVPATKGARASS